ncbi:MAG: radical SAM protein [Deltaproteobacteria bacterium]|nr:radical SAM protein [Deltaproteobacteria bacterium]
MSDSTSDTRPGSVCHLEWFINSRCDYTCRRCVPEASVQDKPDLGLEACAEALYSFVSFAEETARDAHITFYPRQAEFTDPFLTILDTVRDLKTRGLVKHVACAIRGDVPSDKIKLFRNAQVDALRLTIDGPEAVQDELRRRGSFQDTLAAMREARDSGILVIPLVILVEHNAPHVVDTMRMMLDEGFDRLVLQVGIRGDVGGAGTLAGHHPDPESPWNQLLLASEYRAVLVEALNFLDSVRDRHEEFRTRFILANPMYARLLFELGRAREYDQLAAAQARASVLPFALKPDGAVVAQQQLPEIGAFPGGSFKKMFETFHPLRWFRGATQQDDYMAVKQSAFGKCSSCPVRSHCKPMLVGVQDRRLFYHPDVHCWVGEGAVDSGQA